jgi:hypothetical protein
MAAARPANIVAPNRHFLSQPWPSILPPRTNPGPNLTPTAPVNCCKTYQQLRNAHNTLQSCQKSATPESQYVRRCTLVYLPPRACALPVWAPTATRKRRS